MPTPRSAATALVAGGLIVALAGCAGGAQPPAAAPAPVAAPAAADPTAAVCSNLLKIDNVPTAEGDGPGSPTPPAAVKEWASAVAPLLDAAIADAPTAVAGPLTTLKPLVATAVVNGVDPNFDNPAVLESVTAYEAWAHANCGYQKVALTETDDQLTGLPSTLKAGPTSFLAKNTGSYLHVVLIGKPKDPALTIEQLQTMPIEQVFGAVDLLPGAAVAPPGQTSGYLVDLTPGRYVVICPVDDQGQPPQHLQWMFHEITVT